MNGVISAEPLTPEQRVYFRDQLRAARARTFADAEAFDAIVIALERLGKLLSPTGRGLHNYRHALMGVAQNSPLCSALPHAHPAYHTPFEPLLGLVREGRNSAVHEGALARHLASHAVELALVIEDALMQDASVVGDFMVRGPATAAWWQPVSYVRQTMLANSYSYVPVRNDGGTAEGWLLLSDCEITRYLLGEGASERAERLQQPIGTAIQSGKLRTSVAVCVPATTNVSEVLRSLGPIPVLVVGEQANELIGIVTAFDLL